MLVVLGALLVLVGAVWTLQGIGVLGGSVMSGKPLWAVVGTLVAIAGAVLALVNGSARGLLLVLACALVGAALVLFGYLVPRFGLELGGGSILADAAS